MFHADHRAFGSTCWIGGPHLWGPMICVVGVVTFHILAVEGTKKWARTWHVLFQLCAGEKSCLSNNCHPPFLDTMKSSKMSGLTVVLLITVLVSGAAATVSNPVTDWINVLLAQARTINFGHQITARLLSTSTLAGYQSILANAAAGSPANESAVYGTIYPDLSPCTGWTCGELQGYFRLSKLPSIKISCF